MTWNWQQPDWPHFRYDSAALAALEAEFLRQSGIFMGAVRHVVDSGQTQLTIEIISDEALHTSEIEGEMLNRDSLQSSIRGNFGLATDHRRVSPSEKGISEMMVDLYRRFEEPLTHELLFSWHEMLSRGRQDLRDVGRYRTEELPMQIVSGSAFDPNVHFEAPPSAAVPAQMDGFLTWYRETAPTGDRPLPMLTRAGLAHLYFVSIHPFDDGNGRLSRAIAEKVISEGLGQPMLLALSRVINRGRKGYYEQLEHNNKTTDVTGWLVYFAQMIVQAQAESLALVDFIIAKTRYYERFSGQFNPRQEKAIARMMREGPEGFQGGLSAENYIAITGASRATATRDLANLSERGALIRTGVLKGTRYWLPIGPGPPL